MTTETVRRLDEFEVTRCPECASDRIYAFEDSDGGMCTKCKLLVSGPIRGGIGKHEMRRLRGELPEPDPVIEPKKISVAVDVRNVKAVIESLGKSSTAIKPIVKSPSGPGFIEKTVGFFRKFQSELEKTKPKEAPKPAVSVVEPLRMEPPPPKCPSLIEQAKKILMSPAPVPAPPPAPVKSGPTPGQKYSVGKCMMCRLSEKIVGTVVYAPDPASHKYLRIRDTYGHEWLGCFMCSKKA